MVIVRKEESIDSALRRFKKECAKAGIALELKKRSYYVAPSEKRRLKSEAARKRAKKKLAKQKLY